MLMILLFGTSLEIIDYVKLSRKIDMKDLGEANIFLGMKMKKRASNGYYIKPICSSRKVAEKV